MRRDSVGKSLFILRAVLISFCILLLNACDFGDPYEPQFITPGTYPVTPEPTPITPDLELSADHNDLRKYGRVTLTWTSPNTESTYYVYRGNTKIATCGSYYCWKLDPPYEYHYTDSNVSQNSSYTYVIKDKNGIPLSNELNVFVPVIIFQTPDESLQLVEGLVCPQKFWGTWIKMSTGVEYTVYENYITTSENDTFAIIQASDISIQADGLPALYFEDDRNEAVLVDVADVPYFRKGGVNLEYQMKIVGLKSNRAAAGSSFKIKNASQKYSSYTNEQESQDGETFTLTAPTKDDIQTITISNDKNQELAVIPDIVISNSGQNMGTIAISDGTQYTLKVTGTIKEEDKTQGYLYAGKSYPLTLTLKNNSEYTIYSSSLKITPASPNITIRHKSGKSLDGIAVGKMIPESVDNEEFIVSYTGTESGYVDTGLIVEITNGQTRDVWEDYVPLRFFSSVLPVSFSGKSIKNNENGALNGFIVYPDGNSKFFAIRNGGKKTVYVPLFNSTDEYYISFCGATVTKNLDKTEEAFYGVSIGSTAPLYLEDSGANVQSYMSYGGNNHSLLSAYNISKTDGCFEAYLSAGEADYYKFSAGDFSDKSKSVNNISFDTNYHLTYENPKADTIILSWNLESGASMDQVCLYVNGIKKGKISTSSGTYTITKCKPATKYVVYFTDPDDPLITVSNTLGIKTNNIKYTKAEGSLDGNYDKENGGIIFYFKQFDTSNKYEYKDICVCRDEQPLYELKDLPDLYTDRTSQACLSEYGFYMVFSGTGNFSLNYTPKDNLFGFIDMTAEDGLQYTYYLCDTQGNRISEDMTINCW